MQRRENKVAGLRRFHSNLDRLLVTHLSNKNYFRGLAQGSSQRRSETGSVAVEFALMNGGFLVNMQKFNGVFNRQNVVCLFFIYFVQVSGQCRRFPGSDGARD